MPYTLSGMYTLQHLNLWPVVWGDSHHRGKWAGCLIMKDEQNIFFKHPNKQTDRRVKQGLAYYSCSWNIHSGDFKSVLSKVSPKISQSISLVCEMAAPKMNFMIK